jgi:hypothetical protein
MLQNDRQSNCANGSFSLAQHWRRGFAPTMMAAYREKHWRKACANAAFLLAHRWRTANAFPHCGSLAPSSHSKKITEEVNMNRLKQEETEMTTTPSLTLFDKQTANPSRAD